jgi:peptide/nickel transport system substrate-binding protein
MAAHQFFGIVVSRIAIALMFITAMVSNCLAQQPVSGGTIQMAQVAEPPVLISVFNSSAFPGMISTKIHEGLVTYDFSLNPKPALAESWTTAPDGLSMTFKLRKGVKWHDGKPFTSADVKFSLLEGWKKLHPRGQQTFAKVIGVETPDDYTVVLKLSEPSPMILSALNSYESQVIPKHIYEGTDIKTNPAVMAPIGTGPFMFKEWKKGEYISLVRNPNYWDAPKPYLDGIILRVIPDAGARAAAFEKGEVHFGGFTPVPLSDAARLKALAYIGIETKGYEYVGTMYMMELNMRHDALKDKRARQALMHAIDAKFILENIFFGFGKLATGPIPSTSPFYTKEGVPQYEYNVAKANKILDDLGLKRGADNFRFKLTCVGPPMPELVRTAEYVKQAFSQIGVDVDIQATDLASYMRAIYNYDFGISQTWLFLMTDPTIGVQRLYWGKNIRKGVPFTNASGYDDPKVNAWFEAAQVEKDMGKRKALFAEIQKKLQEDLPILNIFEMDNISVFNKKFKNHTMGGDGPFGTFADAYLEK